MISIANNIKIMNTLSSDLINDIQKLRDGSLDIVKANAISNLAQKTITGIARGVMLANHQEIQRNKIIASEKRTKVISSNVDYKKQKLKLKYRGVM